MPGLGIGEDVGPLANFRVDRELGMMKVDLRFGEGLEDGVADAGRELEGAEGKAFVRAPRLGLESRLPSGDSSSRDLDGGREHRLHALGGLDRARVAVDAGRSREEEFRVGRALLGHRHEVAARVHLDLVGEARGAEALVELRSKPVLELPAVAELEEYLADLDQVEGFHAYSFRP